MAVEVVSPFCSSSPPESFLPPLSPEQPAKDNNDNVNDDNDDDDGLPAYSHYDKMPPWWGNVSNDKGGNVSVSNSHHT